MPLLFPLLASRVRLLFPLSLSVLTSHVSRDAGRGALKGRDCSGDAEAGAYTGVCGAAAAQSLWQGHMRRNMAANARSVRAADNLFGHTESTGSVLSLNAPGAPSVQSGRTQSCGVTLISRSNGSDEGSGTLASGTA